MSQSEDTQEHVSQWSGICDCDDCRRANGQPLTPDYAAPALPTRRHFFRDADAVAQSYIADTTDQPKTEDGK